MSIGDMIKAVVKCTLCGAPYGACDCWCKCPKCGWSYEKGKKCRHCSGDGLPRAKAGRRKRQKEGLIDIAQPAKKKIERVKSTKV